MKQVDAMQRNMQKNVYYHLKLISEKFRLIAHVTFRERTIVTIYELKSQVHYDRLCLGIMKNIEI